MLCSASISIASSCFSKSRLPILSKSSDAEFVDHGRKTDALPVNVLSFEIIQSFFLNLNLGHSPLAFIKNKQTKTFVLNYAFKGYINQQMQI